MLAAWGHPAYCMQALVAGNGARVHTLGQERRTDIFAGGWGQTGTITTQNSPRGGQVDQQR